MVVSFLGEKSFQKSGESNIRLRVLSSVRVPVVRIVGEKFFESWEGVLAVVVVVVEVVAAAIEDRVRCWARIRHREQVHSGLLRALLNMSLGRLW